MHNPDSEDRLEKAAIELLEGMGWTWRDCYDEFEGGSSPLGRENRGEVVLKSKLRAALERLNPDTSDEAIDEAVEELTRSRPGLSRSEANYEIYVQLKEGVKVRVPDPADDSPVDVILKVIDWDNPENNDFFLASQFWITGEMYTRRPDVIGFINGLPLVLIELKRVDKSLHDAYQDNLRDYQDTIPHLFWYNALIILSNGSESKFGSLTANWEHFTEWKRIEGETEPGEVSIQTILKGICDHRRLLDIIENFTVFMEAGDEPVKLIAKNHQYLGVNNAVESLQDRNANFGKLGVFWHTQGSGKSISMIFFAQKVLRKIPGGWRFVIVTDRKELDDQIYKNFADSRGVVSGPEPHAENIQHLRQLLSEDHRYIFTLIQKFQTNDGAKHPVLSDRSNIIVITDESHRSQYDSLALNMRTALPNAAFIAFTGTPLIASEERTKEVFGEYVSTYDFRQSIADGATVPLYYENRVPTVQLDNEHLDEDIVRIMENAELDEAQEDRIEREFARQYHLITREERLEAIAEDIVSHFMGRGYRGKAMVISIDKATAVKMYDKVQEHWRRYREELEASLENTVAEEEAEILQARIEYMDQTDMAVVVSQSQNEIDDLRRRDVDIVPHRSRMVREDLDTKFKDPDDPFRIVFVCAMWMTGFDVPSCSTIYLDKPQRNHTLMQTIARANRVFQDKVNGLIVDYIGIFRNLERALAIYAEGTDPEGRNPIRAKSELVEALRETLVQMKVSCGGLGINLDQIDTNTDTFERIAQIDDAVDKIVVNDETKKGYLQRANQVYNLYKAILPDAGANEFSRICGLINIIAQKIKNLTPPPDTSEVMDAIKDLLDRSIVPASYAINADDQAHLAMNLSEIDFDQLREKYRTGRKQIEAEKLRGSINRKLSEMVRLNKTRMDYQKRFEQMIAAYNEAGIDVDVWFNQLVALAGELNEEDQRAIAEQLSEEELAVFDLLTRPEMDLTAEERDGVKTISRRLLTTLKQEQLGLDWRKRERSRAAVKITVQKTLDEMLPECYEQEIFDQKCEAVYQHIYDSYYGAGNSIYDVAA